jgi:hypothetical protein
MGGDRKMWARIPFEGDSQSEGRGHELWKNDEIEGGIANNEDSGYINWK